MMGEIEQIEYFERSFCDDKKMDLVRDHRHPEKQRKTRGGPAEPACAKRIDQHRHEGVQHHQHRHHL